MITFEWVARRVDAPDAETEYSFVVRNTKAELFDLLSRYTPGSPLDAADANAMFQEFMDLAYANKDKAPEPV